jgi:hypothetical protein
VKELSLMVMVELSNRLTSARRLSIIDATVPTIGRSFMMSARPDPPAHPWDGLLLLSSAMPSLSSNWFCLLPTSHCVKASKFFITERHVGTGNVLFQMIHVAGARNWEHHWAAFK